MHTGLAITTAVFSSVVINEFTAVFIRAVIFFLYTVKLSFSFKSPPAKQHYNRIYDITLITLDVYDALYYVI